MIRDNSRILLQEAKGWGGKNFDAVSMSNFYNMDKPYDLGVWEARMFSASNIFGSRPHLARTMAQGNYVVIDSALFKWRLRYDDRRVFTVKHNYTAGNTRPGENNEKFYIGLDENWLAPSDVIASEDNEYNLRIESEAVDVGQAYYRYEVSIQGGPNRYIDPSLLQVGMTFRKVSSLVVNYDNYQYGTTQFGTGIELQSQIGMSGAEFRVDQRMMLEDMRARKNGQKSKMHDGYAFGIMDHNNKPVKGGGFIPYLEAKVLEQVNEDCEYRMEFGRSQTVMSYNGRHIMRNGPGWRQLCEDGYKKIANGALSLTEIQDWLMSIFLTRKNQGDRMIVIDTGTLGHILFDQILTEEARGLLTVDHHYIRQIPGEKAGNLAFGYQFYHYIAKNGLEVKLQLNPRKDDRNLCPQMHPLNPLYPRDSARWDIFDFGRTENSAAPNSSNITAVVEDGVDEYVGLAAVMDPKTGMANDGRILQSDRKDFTIRRAKSCNIHVYDTTRIGCVDMRMDLY